jgi:PEP-CTERM motif
MDAVFRKLTILAPLVLLLYPSSSCADDITFLDGSDHLSFTTSSPSSRISVVCSDTPAEQCIATIQSPGSSFFSSSSISSSGTLLISEPDRRVSDTITNFLIPSVDDTFQVTFTSDSDTPSGIFASSCSSLPDPCIAETGSIQTAETITWSDGTVDTIKFQSDLESTAVPEAGTLLLLGSGVVSLMGLSRRRISARA